MPVTYYVALPFIETEEGPAPGEAKECQSSGAAIRMAEALAHKPGHVGALAFQRSGDPNLGTFTEAEILKTFGLVPDRLEEL
jgi:hypothetical protein